MGTPMYASNMMNVVRPQMDQPPWPQNYSRGSDPRYFQQTRVQSAPAAHQVEPTHPGKRSSSSRLPTFGKESSLAPVPDSAEDQHQPKLQATFPRKRALTACDSCRVKKVKCDNVRPKCGTCVKNKIAECHYRSDDLFREFGALDSVSAGIMMKLDSLIQDVKEIKGEKVAAAPVEEVRRPAVWDMSVSSVLQWKYLQKCAGISPEEANHYITKINSRILQPSEPPTASWSKISSPQFQHDIESFLANNITSIYNSFFLNCHNKIPILDVQLILTMFEVFMIVKRADPTVTFPKILDNRHEDLSSPSSIYASSLKATGARDLEYRRYAYDCLCRTTPTFLMVIALGLMGTEVQLNNMADFVNSLAERDSLKSSCVGEDAAIPEGLPASRMKLAQLVVDYARYIYILYPASLQEHSIEKCLYHLLLTQFELLAMRPLEGYKNIVVACHQILYHLEYKKFAPDDESTQERTNLLFWGCLKIENELRSELSPSVPASGISDVVPPIAFPKVPRSAISQDDNDNSVSGDLKAMSYDFVDRQSWYFFLTEVAFRRVDNLMYEDLFLQDHIKSRAWETEEFCAHGVWHNAVKYLNQYNGIINSLNQKVRDFVLRETNNEQIYKNIKQKWKSLKNETPKGDNVLEDLDEFLMDDDLVIKMQSESIIFIKTRIVTSKLLLFRPLIYLILEDKIGAPELFEAVFAVIGTILARENADNI